MNTPIKRIRMQLQSLTFALDIAEKDNDRPTLDLEEIESHLNEAQNIVDGWMWDPHVKEDGDA